MLNLDAVFNDEKHWKDPDIFRPERHLNEDETKFLKNDRFYPFGEGKPYRLLKKRNGSIIFDVQGKGCALVIRLQKTRTTCSSLLWLRNSILGQYQVSHYQQSTH